MDLRLSGRILGLLRWPNKICKTFADFALGGWDCQHGHMPDDAKSAKLWQIWHWGVGFLAPQQQLLLAAGSATGSAAGSAAGSLWQIFWSG